MEKTTLMVLTVLIICVGCDSSQSQTCTGPGNTAWEANSSAPRPFATVDDQLFILASGLDDVEGFWVYGGTGKPLQVDVLESAGVDTSVNYEDAVAFDGVLLFAGSDSTYGRELWRLDNGQLTMVADLNPGPEDSIGYDSNLTVVSDTVYFTARLDDWGAELWSYDGNSPPRLVDDIVPGVDGSSPGYFTAFGDILVFRAYITPGNSSIWQYDGVSPPSMVAEISNFNSAVTLNNFLYFTGTISDREIGLWRWDGMAAPELVLNDIPWDKAVAHDRLYFTTGISPSILWSYDGMNPPSRVFPGEVDESTRIVTSFKDSLLYKNNHVLWAFDGSSHRIVESNETSWSVIGGSFKEYDDKLYFAGWDESRGEELWVYDDAKASFVADIFPGRFCSEDDE